MKDQSDDNQNQAQHDERTAQRGIHAVKRNKSDFWDGCRLNLNPYKHNLCFRGF